MPGGPELVVIVVVIAVPVAIVLVIMSVSRSRTVGPAVSSTLAVGGDPRRFLESTAEDIHQLNGHSVEWLSADVLQVSWRHRSGWVFVVALLAFPFGLLALFFTMTSYGTIVLVQDGSPATIRLGGELSRAAVGAIQSRMSWAPPPSVHPGS